MINFFQKVCLAIKGKGFPKIEIRKLNKCDGILLKEEIIHEFHMRCENNKELEKLFSNLEKVCTDEALLKPLIIYFNNNYVNLNNFLKLFEAKGNEYILTESKKEDAYGKKRFI